MAPVLLLVSSESRVSVPIRVKPQLLLRVLSLQRDELNQAVQSANRLHTTQKTRLCNVGLFCNVYPFPL